MLRGIIAVVLCVRLAGTIMTYGQETDNEVRWVREMGDNSPSQPSQGCGEDGVYDPELCTGSFYTTATNIVEEGVRPLHQVVAKSPGLHIIYRQLDSNLFIYGMTHYNRKVECTRFHGSRIQKDWTDQKMFLVADRNH